MKLNNRGWVQPVTIVTTILVAFLIVIWSRSSEILAHGGLPDGSWVVSITPVTSPPGAPLPPPFMALITMSTEGRLVETAVLPPCVAPTSTPGHGEWTKISNREFGLTYLKLLSDGTGTLQGIVKVNETIKLDVSETKYSGDGEMELLDPDGNVTASYGISTQGRLIAVELRF
jgi:hypothetical protein